MARIDWEATGRFRPFRTVLESRSFARFYGDARTRPIVESLQKGQSINVSEPFHLHANVVEDGSLLRISVEYVGPGQGNARMPEKPNTWNPLVKYLWALSNQGPNAQFRSSGRFDPTMILAVTAMVEGIEARLQANPSLRRIEIHSPSTQNAALESMLKERFGFQVAREARTYTNHIGMPDTVGSHLYWSADLKTP